MANKTINIAIGMLKFVKTKYTPNPIINNAIITPTAVIIAPMESLLKFLYKHYTIFYVKLQHIKQD